MASTWETQHIKFIRSGDGGKLTPCSMNECTVLDSYPLEQLNSCGWTPPSSEHTFRDTACLQGTVLSVNCIRHKEELQSTIKTTDIQTEVQ